jgi:hypothetical protein
MRMSLLQINVRENRRGNQEWTLQRNRQHWVHKTKYEDEQNNPQKAKMMSNTDPPKPGMDTDAREVQEPLSSYKTPTVLPI